MTEWQNDPWYTRSDEFYALAYKDGKCRYCGFVPQTSMDICNCPGLAAARERFKALVRGRKVSPELKPVQYDANKFTEPEDLP
jgi:hypothetical protein